MNWPVGLFRGYEFLSASEDGARDMYCIKPVNARLARLFQCIFQKRFACRYGTGSGCKKQIVKLNLFRPFMKGCLG